MGSTVAAADDEVQELRTRVARLSRLLDVSRHLASESDLDRLLEYIARTVVDVTSAERCSIFLLDEKRGEIWSKILLSQDEEIRFPRDTGLAGHVITSGEPLIQNRPYEDPRFLREIDTKTGFQTRNILCVPLKDIDGRTIGCFQVVNKVEGEFAESDLEILAAYAAQVAVAIGKARTHEELRQKVRQIETVYELERRLNERDDLGDFVGGVLERAAAAIGAQGASLLLERLSPVGSGPETDRKFELFRYRMDGLIEHIREPDPLPTPLAEVLGTGHARLECPPEADGSRGEYCSLLAADAVVVPLRISEADAADRDRTIGALEVHDKAKGGFTASDLSVLQIFSSQVSSAIVRRRMREAQTNNERLATIGSLARGIVHDFRGPMASISGFVEMMRRKELDRDRREEVCGIILTELGRCADMAREILDFCRGRRKLEPRDVPADRFFDQIRAVLELELKRCGLALEMDIEDQAPLHIDPARFKRAIFNLTGNARDALPEGGTITLSSRTLPSGESEIRIGDDGPGIPAEIQPILFEPFVTHGKKSGTGLGLAISREIIENHGGHLSLDPTVPRGACFVITLPAPTSRQDL